jgi:hypothetical protein
VRPSSEAASGNCNSVSTARRDDFGNTTPSIPFVVSETPIQPHRDLKTIACRIFDLNEQ